MSDKDKTARGRVEQSREAILPAIFEGTHGIEGEVPTATRLCLIAQGWRRAPTLGLVHPKINPNGVVS